MTLLELHEALAPSFQHTQSHQSPSTMVFLCFGSFQLSVRGEGDSGNAIRVFLVKGDVRQAG